MKTITAVEAATLQPAPLFIDVRTPAEFSEVHIPDSKALPLHQFEPAAFRSLLEPGRHAVLVCRSGVRAAKAAEKLPADTADVVILEGGVEAWAAAGHAVNRGTKRMSIERQVRVSAGSLVLLGVILGFTLHPGFFGLSAFVGAGLIFAGITDWCGMGLLLARMPWNN